MLKNIFLLIFIPLELLGFSYEYLSDGCFSSIHVLLVNPQEHLILPVKANSRETVAALANQYGAAAAVNGGFWKLNGDPAGILKINNLWYGFSVKPRGAIGWTRNGQKVLIDRLLTLHSEDEVEIIPASDPPLTPEEWKEMDHIVGGTPVLVSKGQLIEDYSSEQTLKSFLTKKHPRTAVGIRANGEWVFVVVDGYFHHLFGGMKMKKLAKLMLDLGCIDALNLDGGGSSTMVVNGIVINSPSEKREEAVSDAILIFSHPSCDDF